MKPPKPSLMKALDALHRNRKRGLSLTQLDQRTELSRDGIRDCLSKLRTRYRVPIEKVNGRFRIRQDAEVVMEGRK
jgi:hypothetical protein